MRKITNGVVIELMLSVRQLSSACNNTFIQTMDTDALDIATCT